MATVNKKDLFGTSSKLALCPHLHRNERFLLASLKHNNKDPSRPGVSTPTSILNTKKRAQRRRRLQQLGGQKITNSLFTTFYNLEVRFEPQEVLREKN